MYFASIPTETTISTYIKERRKSGLKGEYGENATLRKASAADIK